MNSDTATPSSADEAAWSIRLCDSIDEQRRRARLFLSSQQQRLSEIETNLSEGLGSLVAELGRKTESIEQRGTEWEQHRSSLEAQSEQIAGQKRELDIQREAFRKDLAQFEEDRRVLQSQREELIRRETETREQRRNIGRQLRAQHNEQRAQIEAMRAEIAAERDELLQLRKREESETDRRLAETRTRCEQLEERLREDDSLREIAASLESEVKRLEGELRAAEENAGRGDEQNTSMRKIFDEEKESLERDRNEKSDQIQQLEKERNCLLSKLEDLEKNGGEEIGNEQLQHLQQRFDMAIQDIRELKRRNAELEDELRGRKEPSGTKRLSASTGDENLDWETQKQRILAQLEAELDERQISKQDRVTIESTLRITDEVVAAKDREIAELKVMLEEQANNHMGRTGDVAVGVAAIAELLDRDELVLRERQNLKRIQAEWQEKLRKAEIDISVERAKLARERSEFEEQRRTFEARQKQNAPEENHDSTDKSKRGRWLTRLGLKDEG